MKFFFNIFLLLFIFFFYSNSISQSSWQVVHQADWDCDFNTVFLFPDGQKGWAAGTNGTIIRTINGGTTWLPIQIDNNDDITDVFFIDSQHGWLVAAGYKDKIYSTTNGGETWISANNKWFPKKIYFADTLNGWSAGPFYITHTSDGGKNWIQQLSTDAWLNDICFVNNKTGWAVGSRIVYKTTDGGLTWNGLSVQSNSLYSVCFTDTSYGWAVGWPGLILHTTNGGKTWNQLPSGVNENLYTVHFTDSLNGWIAGYNGLILHTDDGGQIWKKQSSGINSPINTIHFNNSLNGYAAGGYGSLIFTTDGGNNWVSKSNWTGENLNSVHFIGNNNGWISGMYGTVLHTSDGGLNWFKQESGTTEYLESIYFADTNKGWTVGNNGAILYSKNGGSSWIKQTNAITNHLYSVKFYDDLNGWIAGDRIILYTTDAGSTWISQPSSPNTLLTSLFFTKDMSGWTAGADGNIYHTQGIGNAWLKHNDNPYFSYSGVFFIDNLTGWLVGGNGGILHTSDGGNSWIMQESGTKAILTGVHFVDSHNGWAVGNNGIIVHTSDAGKTWTFENSGIKKYIFSVTFIDYQTGWAVGQNGTILKYTNTNGTVPAKLEFTSPNQTNSVIYGFMPFDIRWRSSGDSGQNVKIDVYRGEDFIANVTESTPNDGSFSWTPAPSFPPGSDYSFVITLASDPSVTARSDNFIVVMKKLAYTANQISATSVPVLDGKLDDPVWANVTQDSLLFGGLNGQFGAIWSSFSDNLVTWKAAWCRETNKLYVAASVHDDTLGVFDNEPSSSFYLPYYDEAIEFFTDGDHIGEEYWGLCGPAQQWRVTEQNNRDLYNYPDAEHNHQVYTGNAFATAVQKDNHGNWTCEAVFTIYNHFPDSVRTLAQGDTIGWDVWYDDSDNRNFNETYYIMDHQVGWNFQGKAWRNTNFMGNMVLGPQISTLVKSENALPETDRLDSNYPNPFNPSTTIRYALSRPGRAEISIVDVTGKRIRTLVNGIQNSGIHTVEWDGKDDSHIPVSSGVYMLVFKTDNHIEQRKITLIR